MGKGGNMVWGTAPKGGGEKNERPRLDEPQSALKPIRRVKRHTKRIDLIQWKGTEIDKKKSGGGGGSEQYMSERGLNAKTGSESGGFEITADQGGMKKSALPRPHICPAKRLEAPNRERVRLNCRAGGKKAQVSTARPKDAPIK